MWTCPDCGREFKRNRQSHYCGKAPETVEEYISSQTPEKGERLACMRKAVLKACPDAREYIAWSMPYYSANGKTLSFAAGARNISLYAGADAAEQFAARLDGYAVNKNAIYFPYNRALPLELISGIARWCLGCREENIGEKTEV